MGINGKHIGRKTKYEKFQSFDNEQEAIKFENEKRALNKLQQKRESQKQRQSKTKEQRREEGLLKYGGNNECESEAIRQLVKLLENNWKIVLIRDGSHNDIGLQKKIVKILIYIMVFKSNHVLSKERMGIRKYQ